VRLSAVGPDPPLDFRNHAKFIHEQAHPVKFVVICLFSVFAVPSIQQEHVKPSASIPACRKLTFGGRINGGADYSHALGGDLSLRLAPSLAPPNENWGWVIQVQPLASDDDYAWPVNPPFHFGNSQWLSTGYNETAQQQLSYEHEVFFVISKAEYERAAKLANDALDSPDPEAAGRFLAILPTLRSAVLKLKPVKYLTTNEGKSVSWMQFSVTVTVPASFQPAPGLVENNIACP
jgi:hypothetical protein